jgi:hypothetical protein
MLQTEFSNHTDFILVQTVKVFTYRKVSELSISAANNSLAFTESNNRNTKILRYRLLSFGKYKGNEIYSLE